MMTITQIAEKRIWLAETINRHLECGVALPRKVLRQLEEKLADLDEILRRQARIESVKWRVNRRLEAKL